MKRIGRKISNLLLRIRCPLTTCLIQLAVIAGICYYFSYNHYYYSVSDSKIKTKINATINQCGEGYYISWIVLDTKYFHDKYFFQDVIGCNKNKAGEGCAFSVKDKKLNKFYNESHYIDDKSYHYLDKLDTGDVLYFTTTNDLYQYPSIYQALNSTNKKIFSGGITVIKNTFKNIVYIFALTETNANKVTCNRHQITNYLEDISKFAKKNL